MMKNVFNLFLLMVGCLFVGLLFTGSVFAAGTYITSEGVQFPDGTVQKTKAVETGVPGPQGEKGDPGFTSAISPVPKTGQTKCYNGDGDLISCTGTGQDGNLQRGFSWPNPRFADNGDGTVTDNLTALIWLKNANCFGQRNWATALNDCNTLASGSCGLSDSSLAGDWRLPNMKELQSLIDIAFSSPALSNDAGTGPWTGDTGSSFSGVLSSYYWSSSTSTWGGYTFDAWRAYMASGRVDGGNKVSNYYVWPVRSGN